MLRFFMGVLMVAILIVKSTIVPAGESPFLFSCGAGAMSGSVNIAEVKGFFLENGINGKVISFRKGQVGFDTYIAEKADIGLASVMNIVMTDFDVQKHKIIGTLSYTDNQTKVLARKSAGIYGVKDLKGKRIATVSSTVSHFYLCKLLVLNGISCSDIDLVFMSKKKLPKAIASGEVDAVCQHGIPIENAKKLLKDDWTMIRDGLIHRKPVFLIAPVALLNNSSGKVTGVLKSILRAERFIQTDTEECIRILANAKKYSFEAMKETVTKEIEYDLSLRQTIYMALETVEQWAIDSHLVKREQPRNYMDFVDYGPLESVAPEKVSIIR